MLTPSLLALLLANAFPIVGVLFLGWTVFPLVLLYWLENVVVGAFNVARLLLAQPREPAYWAGKLFLIPFFVVHFGMLDRKSTRLNSSHDQISYAVFCLKKKKKKHKSE